ncbi:hypothetical protein LTR12_000358 [Friedmanniomyces endolithicus]|nr:hypothetical protein LTR12_000358 [Friedmanniomyces endolithicus]
MTTTWTSDEHDDYWKIRASSGLTVKDTKAVLEERGYHVGGIKDQGYLHYCNVRCNLGLPSYHKVDIHELRQRIKKRKIDTTAFFDKSSSGNRRELLAALDHADSNPRFERFLRLAQELRNKIYENYYDELATPIYAPSQPPLSRVCAQLRRESLPMFYATCEFEVRFERLPRPSTAKRFVMCDRMLLFLHSTEPKYLTSVRSLYVVVDESPKDVNEGLGEDGDHAVEMLGYLTVSQRATPLENVAKSKAGAAVRELVATISARPAKNKLRKNDFFELRKAVELVLG